MIHSLSKLVRSIQTIHFPKFNSIAQVKEAFAKYSGDDWQEFIKRRVELTTLFKDGEHFNLDLLTIPTRSSTHSLVDNRQYVIRVMDGAIRLKTPLTGFEKNLFPSSEMYLYHTKNPSQVECLSTYPSVVLMFHRKL